MYIYIYTHNHTKQQWCTYQNERMKTEVCRMIHPGRVGHQDEHQDENEKRKERESYFLHL